MIGAVPTMGRRPRIRHLWVRVRRLVVPQGGVVLFELLCSCCLVLLIEEEHRVVEVNQRTLPVDENH